MKSAYCIAITTCLTSPSGCMRKEKAGDGGKALLESSAGYLITRFVFFCHF